MVNTSYLEKPMPKRMKNLNIGSATPPSDGKFQKFMVSVKKQRFKFSDLIQEKETMLLRN